MNKKYVMQMRQFDWSPWEVIREYATLAEAKSDYDALPIKAGHRIAEAYTVVRYKAVKV